MYGWKADVFWCQSNYDVGLSSVAECNFDEVHAVTGGGGGGFGFISLSIVVSIRFMIDLLLLLF